MKKIVISLLLLILGRGATASTLADFVPQPPAGNPWSDAWYYYIHDPDVGYFKIVFLSYLNANTGDDRQHAYLHVVFAPKSGEQRVYEHHYEQVKASPQSGGKPYAFTFDIPGAARIDHTGIDLTLPEVTFRAKFSDEHTHYSAGSNPGASPFGWLTALPFVENQWFVFSLATPARYHFKDATSEYRGRGLTYIDRGWNTEQAAGMIYLMAVSEDVKLMFTAGVDNNLPLETWAGRLISEKSDLTFSPSLKGLGTSSEVDVCSGTATVEMRAGQNRVRIVSSAPIASFYNHTTPSLTVFQQRNPVMKSMAASAIVEVYRDDVLVESLEVEQSILEFGGSYYCDALHPERAIQRASTR